MSSSLGRAGGTRGGGGGGHPGKFLTGAGDALANPRTTVYTLTCTQGIFQKKEQEELAIKAKLNNLSLLLTSKESRGRPWPWREQ